MTRFAKTSETLIRQSLAWLAMVAVCVNPVIVSGAQQCGCSKKKTSEPAVAKTAPITSCCCSKTETAVKPARSCCSSHEPVVVASKSAECECGEKCRCSNDESRRSPPAVPANSQSQTDHLSVALQAEAAFADHTIQTAMTIRYGRWLSQPPELTALETCALLSRFTC